MRYIKHHLETIVGIEIYPIISLLIFVLFFIGLTLYVIVMKNPQVQYLSEMPLKDTVNQKEESDENKK